MPSTWLGVAFFRALVNLPRVPLLVVVFFFSSASLGHVLAALFRGSGTPVTNIQLELHLVLWKPLESMQAISLLTLYYYTGFI